MKKILYRKDRAIMLLLAIICLHPSCKKLIDIPPNPPTAITEAQVFADSATAMTAIAGIYTYASNGSAGFTFNDGLITLCSGMSSDELVPTNTSNTDMLQFYNNSVTAFSGTANSLWVHPYTGLYPVNAAISGIAASAGLSTGFKKQLTAELKVMRALYYFNLVNLFGGVPLIISTDYRAGAVLGRASSDSVYGQVLRDLTDARQDLPVDYPSEGRLRPNQYTVAAFLAKVYLYRKEWQKSYDAATAVIGSGLYALETDLNNVFLDGSQEAIWQIPAIGSYKVTTEASTFIPYASGVIPNYIINAQLLDAFEPGDKRVDNWLASATVNVSGSDQTFYYPFKYKNSRPASTTEDYMIFRLGEQYLIRAEAAAHLGNTGEALDDLDLVRARAGLDASTAVSGQDVLDAIQHERQTELFTEWGNRWMDLKRTGTIDAVLGTEKSGWDPHDALYPVPNAQILANRMLKQNDGY